MAKALIQMNLGEGLQMAQSANWLKRIDRLLCREA